MKGFRVAREASTAAHVATTAVQMLLFWSLFLFAIPHFVQRIGRSLGEGTLALPAHRAIGVAGFGLASCLGLVSAWTMATRGEGTPLPFATARRFVAKGPYRRLRNPMALAGIAQGVAVGVFRDSGLVVLYSLVGAILWHLVARPPEERDLRERFGPEYEQYRASVPLWTVRMPWSAALACVGGMLSFAIVLVATAPDVGSLAARGSLAAAALLLAFATYRAASAPPSVASDSTR